MNHFAQYLAVLCIVLLAGCSQPPQLVGEAKLVLNPSGHAPLSGLLIFTSDQPARATLTIGDGENSITATPSHEFAIEHELMVLGLRPDRINSIELLIENQSGQAGVPLTLQVETEPLPENLPPINVVLSRPARMEPGVTLLPLFQTGDDEHGRVIGLDAQGEAIWFYDGILDEPRRLSNGNLLAIADFVERRSLVELDMLGNIVRQWYAIGVTPDAPDGTIPVDIDTFHHDVLEMPSGNFLALSSEVRHIESYPTSDTDPKAPREPRDVIVDKLVEIRPDDGAVLREWKLFDLIDTTRVPHNFDATNFHQYAYDDIFDEPLLDWSHANGIDYDQATDSVLMSIRKMSAVVKIDLGSGKLMWILGDPSGWSETWNDLLLEPQDEVQWSYGHHAPELLPSGNLLLYDNGSYGRAYAPNEGISAEENYSRAVEYRIDETNGTVSQVWSYGGPDRDQWYSDYVSEADRLPQTGNVLLTNGGQMKTIDGTQTDDSDEGRNWLSLMEVTHAMPVEKVWEVVVDTPAGGWGAYRSERMPSLYP